jgi:hypothetical protein
MSLCVKPFYLLRHEDASGISGIGVVAVGAVLPSGRAILEWLSNETTDTIFESIEQVTRIHGHNGKTEVIYGNPPDPNKPKRSRKKKES